ncbi:hypothetical protein [Azospirillum sp. TSO5]|uniref:hypothetical protein n=1 Tax=Azospirillum sp. TSO5 TaxID=716760 RepID=UPI000D613A18|nr:hypothetical protein [Azospirillum sp. TSO5]PWC91869.1 hypothetical protein TSO5_18610 [Azospirillum sp. TSO5]
MNTALPARVAALRERLTRLHQTGADVAEASELEGLRADLAVRAARLVPQLEKGRLLGEAAIVVPEPASLTEVRKKALGIQAKFSAVPRAATLKKGQAWRTMLEQIDTAGRDLANTVMAAWKGHRSVVFAGETPGAIETKLAKTKANTEALRVYETLYHQFKIAFDSLPADWAAIERARRLGGELEAAARVFDFNVPAEVKSFLEAVQSVSGAPLDLLTPAVLEWLRENGGTDGYRVRSADRT